MSELTPGTGEPTPTSASSNENTTNGRSHRKGGSRATSRFYENKAFTGESPDLEAVLGLASEKLYKGVSFEIFQEKVKTYVLKNYTRPEDVLPLIVALKDPSADFKTNNKPADLSDTETNPSKIRVWELKYKRFITRTETLEGNKLKLYGLIIGQCTTALRASLKGEDKYEEKNRDFETE